MPEVEVRGLEKRYGRVRAVDGVDLTVRDGEYLAIVGPSGCGKSTLFRLMAGIERPDRGDVLFDGMSVLDVPMEERGVALVFQNIALFPHMTALGNASYSPRVRGAPPGEARSAGLKALRRVGARVRPEGRPSEMSMGEMQAVALARALAAGPRVLLLDEPLSALDHKVAVELRGRLRELVKSEGLTALHVTHDQEEAMAVADRLAVMRRGRVIQVGTPEELYRNPATPFVMNFVGEANFLVGTVRSGFVELRAGTRVPAPGWARDGDAALVAFRPESVDLSGGPMSGRVVGRSYLGIHVRIEVALSSGERIRAILPDDPGVGEGEEVRLDLSDPRVFPYPGEGLAEALAP